MRDYVGENIKYVLLNHTWHSLAKVSSFDRCDLYISVCNFLKEHVKWQYFIDSSRIIVILNGIENDYIKDLPSAKLKGKFKTGRCHRLVRTKFNPDSLHWMDKNFAKTIPGFAHYIIGNSRHAKTYCKRSKICKYYGIIGDRNTKMSIIKDLDLYFYETFQHEGASIALLEALAAGVPVLCNKYGGNSELIQKNINGVLCRDRKQMGAWLEKISKEKHILDEWKQNVVKDFDDRLHVRHAACKYMQVFETLLKE